MPRYCYETWESLQECRLDLIEFRLQQVEQAPAVIIKSIEDSIMFIVLILIIIGGFWVFYQVIRKN